MRSEKPTGRDRPYYEGDKDTIPVDRPDREDRTEEIDQKSPGERAEPLTYRENRFKLLGFFGGLIGAAIIYFLMPGDVENADGEITNHASVVAATAVLMGVWWMTQAIPIPATALVPLVIFPIFTNNSVDSVGASYGNNVIFLFMGGFLIALAMQRWNLHKRVALTVVRAVGTNPDRVILGFMIATGFITMWVSNTATAVMMIPIGIAVIMLVLNITKAKEAGASEEEAAAAATIDDEHDTKESQAAVKGSNFGTALVLGIAYSSSIGSLATLIGTPPNAFLAGYMSQEFGITIGFGQWMIMGLPLAIVFLLIAWFILVKVIFKPEVDEIPGGRELISTELDKLGPMSKGEKRVGLLFLITAISWVSIPLISDYILGLEDPFISDAGIAMVAGVVLFTFPSGHGRGIRLLDWDSALALPWGVLILFGGGLALSGGFSSSGLSEWLGVQAEAISDIPVWLFAAVLAAMVLLLTEMTSNTATAATFIPLVAGLSLGISGAEPLMFAIPVAIVSTCAFMLPVGTPPNAIAFGSGYVTIGQMVRGGVWLNVIAIFLVMGTVFTIGAWVFDLAYF